MCAWLLCHKMTKKVFRYNLAYTHFCAGVLSVLVALLYSCCCARLFFLCFSHNAIGDLLVRIYQEWYQKQVASYHCSRLSVIGDLHMRSGDSEVASCAIVESHRTNRDHFPSPDFPLHISDLLPILSQLTFLRDVKLWDGGVALL